MREIVFRGKRIDNAEWVEGDLLRTKFYSDDPEHSLIFTATVEFPRGEFSGANEVIPETVGQYTGMKDKNGKRIFEGDIVMFLDYTEPAFIVWDQEDARWFMRYSDCMLDFSYKCVPSAIEVIGNIHDNPELIAEVEK